MPQLPLAGIRILDMTVVWAGPQVTTFLADLGAEVIRVENPWIFPSSTRGLAARPHPAQLASMGFMGRSYPDADPGERPWNRSAVFNCHGRNKKAMTLDLRQESGREIFLELVERADVLVENNAPRVLDKLDLGWDVLHARNPRFIAVRMPALGFSGSYMDYIGFGANFEAIAGLTATRGYHDSDLSTTTSTFHMDPVTGATGAFAVMAALQRRAATGEGVLVEMSQAENVMQQIGDLVVHAAKTGAAHPPLGNRHRARAPQGCYPCAGEDRWAVISVGTDEEWDGLVRAMGSPAWAADERFATIPGRRAHHDELDGLIAEWTRELDPYTVFHRCQAEGVPAGPVTNEADSYADPQLRERGFFREITSPHTGTHEYPGFLFRWTGPDMAWWRGSPGLGEDNDYVYRDILGFDDDRYEAAKAAGHVTLDYLQPDGSPM